jgi:hypothetical protein
MCTSTGPKLSSSQKQFRDKSKEVISIIKKVRSVQKRLRAMEESLKVLADEALKTKAELEWYFGDETWKG